jgi:hypothetical protein
MEVGDRIEGRVHRDEGKRHGAELLSWGCRRRRDDHGLRRPFAGLSRGGPG